MHITIALTPQEKDALLGLIDLAVKAGGLNVAGNAAFLAQKIVEATKAAEAKIETLPPCSEKL